MRAAPARRPARQLAPARRARVEDAHAARGALCRLRQQEAQRSAERIASTRARPAGASAPSYGGAISSATLPTPARARCRGERRVVRERRGERRHVASRASSSVRGRRAGSGARSRVPERVARGCSSHSRSQSRRRKPTRSASASGRWRSARARSSAPCASRSARAEREGQLERGLEAQRAAGVEPRERIARRVADDAVAATRHRASAPSAAKRRVAAVAEARQRERRREPRLLREPRDARRRRRPPRARTGSKLALGGAQPAALLERRRRAPCSASSSRRSAGGRWRCTGSALRTSSVPRASAAPAGRTMRVASRVPSESGTHSQLERRAAARATAARASAARRRARRSRPRALRIEVGADAEQALQLDAPQHFGVVEAVLGGDVRQPLADPVRRLVDRARVEVASESGSRRPRRSCSRRATKA